MALVPLELPPGISRNGTEHDNKGHWFDCTLVRFYEGVIRPWGGWRVKSLSAVTGVGRASHAWKSNDGISRLAIGTENHLYVMTRDGTIDSITPDDLATG